MKTIWYPTLDSTNSEALRQLDKWAHLTVIAAREQTAGRGQRGNTWFSQPGKNLTFSIVCKWQPGWLKAADAHWLNYAISEAVALFLRSWGIACSIKWPNDIYVGRHKICGILIENTLQEDWVSASVVGVGLNVNQQEFPQVAGATSLWRCLGRECDLEESLQRVVGAFEKNLPMLETAEQRESLFRSYSHHLFQRDINARYHDYLEDRVYVGILRGVEPDGRLHIDDLDAHQARFYRFKEVGFVL